MSLHFHRVGNNYVNEENINRVLNDLSFLTDA